LLDNPRAGIAYSIIGNVPCSITKRILRKLIDAENPPTDAWRISQWETAGRFYGVPFKLENQWSRRLKSSWQVEVLNPLQRSHDNLPPTVDCALV